MTTFAPGTGIRDLLVERWLRARPDLAPGVVALTRELDLADARRQEAATREGVPIPETLVISLTSACNLRCPGCGIDQLVAGPRRDLAPEVLDEAVSQALALGIQRFALLGGEPLLSPLCDRLVLEHPQCFFTLLTNGRPLTEDRAARLASGANCLLLLNVGSTSRSEVAEALDPGAIRATSVVREAGLLFAVAATVTRLNHALLGRRDTLDQLAGSGAGLAVFFDHAAGFDGAGADLSLPRDARRAWVAGARRDLSTRGLPVLCIPEDEWVLGGCAAAGRLVLHVSVHGTIEPCPFVPFSSHHVRREGLLGALRSGFFRDLRDHEHAWESVPGACAYRAAAAEFREVCRCHGVGPSAAATAG
jgi:MoaA/NifB/PqqE/SkfB family radical SAM enzyme